MKKQSKNEKIFKNFKKIVKSGVDEERLMRLKATNDIYSVIYHLGSWTRGIGYYE